MNEARRPRRILLVCAHFAPENTAGTYRSLHLARSLRDGGYDVRVLTRALHEIDRPQTSLSEVFPDDQGVVRVAAGASWNDRYLRLRGLLRPARPEGGAAGATSRPVAAPRATPPAPEPRRRSDPSLRRLLAEGLSFPDEQVGWVRPARRTGAALVGGWSPDLVFVSGPPFSAFSVATALADGSRARLVVDFRDPWGKGTGSGTRYKHPVWKALAHRMEHDAIARSSLALFNSPGLQEAAEAFLPEFADRYRTIVNGSEAPRRDTARAIPTTAPLRFSHIGVLYAGRNLESLVRGLTRVVLDAPGGAAVEVEQIGPHADPAALGVHPGETPPFEIRQRGVVSRTEALALSEAPGVLVVVQSRSTRPQIPSKLFDYLATGNPVLVVSPEDSAVWRLAREFPRCHRIELEHGPGNVDTLRRVVQAWSRGTLRQERTVDDTAHLTREATGRQLVDALTDVLEG